MHHNTQQPLASQPEQFSAGHEVGYDSEIGTISQTLRALEKRIADQRIELRTHAAEAQRLNQEWEKRLRKHRDVQRELKATGHTAERLLEGWSFDLDILKYVFQRWMYRVDRNY